MLGESHGGIAEADGVLDDVFEVIFCMAWTELSRVGVHCESHLELLAYLGRLGMSYITPAIFLVGCL